jgi:hypothetical protein
MAERTEPDPTDPGTLRPNAPPLKAPGAYFTPLEPKDWNYTINLPSHIDPWNPITLFLHYYNKDIIDLIVECTNQCEREAQDPKNPYARANSWFPTDAAEIYIYLAIRIQLTIMHMDRIEDYWSQDPIKPKVPIMELMTRNRYQELNMRYRLTPPGVKDPFKRVPLDAPLYI